MGNLFLGILIGIIIATISWFFIAKNNQRLMLWLFSQADSFPDGVKQKVVAFIKDQASKL